MIEARQDTATAMTTRQIAAAWSGEARQRAFFSARVAEVSILKELHRVCTQVVEGKMSPKQATRLVQDYFVGEGADALARLGFAPPRTQRGISELGSTARLMLIFNTNLKLAQETGHYRQWSQVKEVFPYGIWHCGNAKEHRKEHLARDGRAFPFNHPIWTVSPPGGEFNCHCWREVVSAEELERRGITPEDASFRFAPSSLGFDPSRPISEQDPGVPADLPPEVREKAEQKLSEDRTRPVEPEPVPPPASVDDGARRKAEEEARRRAEEAARIQAEAEARREAEEEARRAAEEAARKAAEEEARRQAEEARRQAEEAARRAAEEEARRKAEEAKRAEEEAKRKAEEVRRAEEEARRAAEEEARRKAEEEARRAAEEEARRKAEREERRKAREEDRTTEENARRKTEEDGRKHEDEERTKHVQRIQEELEQLPAGKLEADRTEGCREQREAAEEGKRRLDPQITTLLQETPEKRQEALDAWQKEKGEYETGRLKGIKETTDRKRQIDEDLKAITAAFSLGTISEERSTALARQQNALLEMARRCERRLLLAQWDQQIDTAAYIDANVSGVVAELSKLYPDLAKSENRDFAESIARRQLYLQARRISASLQEAFRPGMEQLGEKVLPTVAMEDTAKNALRSAFYQEGIIHLDCRFGNWNGLPGTAQHELGHWVDDMTRKWNEKQPEETVQKIRAAVTDAAKQDSAALKARMAERAGGRTMTKRQNIAMFGDHRHRYSGTFWNEVSNELFGHPWRAGTQEEQYVIVSYADTLQSISKGTYGWGHRREYAQKDKERREAIAEAFFAYVRKDTHYRNIYQHLWDYIKSIVEGKNA